MNDDRYNKRRAAEADRLALDANDPHVRATHEHFAAAYRERIKPEAPPAKALA